MGVNCLTKLAKLLLCLPAAALLAGCFPPDMEGNFVRTQREVQILQRRVQLLEGKLEGINSDLASRTASLEQKFERANLLAREQLASRLAVLDELRAEVQALRGRTEEIQFRLEREQKPQPPLLSRDDFLSTIEDLRKMQAGLGQSQATLNQNLVSLSNRLSSVEKTVSQQPPGVPKVTPPASTSPPAAGTPSTALTPEEQYKAADLLRSSGNLGAAKEKYEEFLKLFPDSPLASNSQYWIGEIYYAQGEYDRSILAFERVLTGYSKSDKVPDAMFKQAKAFLALKDGNSAKILLRKVMSDFPNSNAAKLAAQQLKSLN